MKQFAKKKAAYQKILARRAENATLFFKLDRQSIERARPL